MNQFKLLDEDLINEIASLPEDDREAWLFLAPHPEFKGAWYIDSLDPSFLFDFEDIIGEYRVLFPGGLGAFEERCREAHYQYAFASAPDDILGRWTALERRPLISINGSLPGNIQGFLPWQIRGFNKLILPEDIRGGLCLWDTGTGKTVFIAAGINWHLLYKQEADLALVVVKSNNKRDMQKKLKQLGDIDSVILDGTAEKRAKLYNELDEKDKAVAITNYEKFRNDEDFFSALITGRRVVIFWDEMPTKLKNRGTRLYQSVKDVLYKPSWGGAVKWDKKRPDWLRQYELTATPIETNPGNQFSCVRLIDPEVLGNVTQFEKDHVATRNPVSKMPEKWHRIDKMGHRLNHMMHRVDKTDPEIAKYFPEMIEDTIYIDQDPKLAKLYSSFQKQAELALEEDDEVSVLSMIHVAQMLCDAPTMLKTSANNREAFENAVMEALETDDMSVLAGIKTGSDAALRFMQGAKKVTNDGHPKWERLYEDLFERFPNEKAIIFSTWSDYIFPIFEEKLNEWGVTYEIFRGTDKQRQRAKDRWRNDSACRLLVSSDAGSDSIDLPEASLVINFNLPYLYSRRYQRIHRASRANSTHQTLWVLDYVIAGSVEERRQELIELRKGYNDELVGAATSSSYSKEDMLYLLTGISHEDGR